jgi:hypothetical protein
VRAFLRLACARLSQARNGDLQKECCTNRRLGTPFHASDYPTTLDGLFNLEVSYPTIELPGYLMALHPDVYQQEQAQIRERLESAVEIAEQAFTTELRRLSVRSRAELDILVEQAQQTISGIAPQTLRDSNRLRRNTLRRGGVGGAA